MGKFFLAILAITLLVYAMFDLIATPRDQARVVPKALWFVLVLLIPVIGPALWLTVGHPRTWRPPSGGQQKPRPPRGPRGPDDDPDYLRGL